MFKQQNKINKKMEGDTLMAEGFEELDWDRCPFKILL